MAERQQGPEINLSFLPLVLHTAPKTTAPNTATPMNNPTDLLPNTMTRILNHLSTIHPATDSGVQGFPLELADQAWTHMALSQILRHPVMIHLRELRE